MKWIVFFGILVFGSLHQSINGLGTIDKKFVIIVGQYRSGSSFTGELLSSFPLSFYYFEPFHYLRNTTNRAPNDNQGIKIMDGLLNCNFDDLMASHEWKGPQFVMQKEYKQLLADSGSNTDEDDDYKSEVIRVQHPWVHVKEKCIQSNGIVMKTIRLRMDLVETFFHHLRNVDESPVDNFHVVLLIRDPRAILNSRAAFAPCHKRKECLNSRKLCRELGNDYDTFRRLQTKFPANFHLMKFEDLVANPNNVTFNLFNHFGLKFTERAVNYIDSHTRPTNESLELVKGHPFVTFRESEKVVEKWKTSLRRKVVRTIERNCERFLNLLNYEKLVVK